MTKANDLASLLDANGDVVSSALDNVPSADLVNDTTPQLGGSLDLNSNDITGTGNIDISGSITADGLTLDTEGDAITFVTSGSPTPQIKTADSVQTNALHIEAENAIVLNSNKDDTDLSGVDAVWITRGSSYTPTAIFDANGNVGIGGVTSPAVPLHVNNAASSACRVYLQNTGNTAAGYTQIWSQNDDLVLNAGNAERMRIKNSEVVVNETGADVDFRCEADAYSNAIWLEASTGQLHLDNNRTNFGGVTQETSDGVINLGIANFRNPTTTSGQFMSIDCEGSSSAQNLVHYWYDGSGYRNRLSIAGNTGETVFNESSQDIDFRVESDSNAYALFLDAANSRWGINTSGPTNSLDIGFADLGSAAIGFRTSTYSNIAKIVGSHDSGTAEGSLSFQTRTGGSVLEKMSLEQSEIRFHSTYSFMDASISDNGQLIGAIGAYTTTGTTDWNHSTNARSGNGHTLLLGSATNGPGGSSYYHPFCFEYHYKDATGNLTQWAIGYNTNARYMRYRYQGTWTSWVSF